MIKAEELYKQPVKRKSTFVRLNNFRSRSLLNSPSRRIFHDKSSFELSNAPSISMLSPLKSEQSKASLGEPLASKGLSFIPAKHTTEFSIVAHKQDLLKKNSQQINQIIREKSFYMRHRLVDMPVIAPKSPKKSRKEEDQELQRKIMRTIKYHQIQQMLHPESSDDSDQEDKIQKLLNSSKFVKFDSTNEHNKSYIASPKNPLEIAHTRENSVGEGRARLPATTSNTTEPTRFPQIFSSKTINISPLISPHPPKSIQQSVLPSVDLRSRNFAVGTADSSEGDPLNSGDLPAVFDQKLQILESTSKAGGNQRYGKQQPILLKKKGNHLAVPKRDTSLTTMEHSLTNKKKGGILQNTESIEELEKTHEVVDSERPVHLLSQVSINSIQKLEELEELTKGDSFASPVPFGNSRQNFNLRQTSRKPLGPPDSSILSIRGIAQPKSHLTLMPVLQSPKPQMKIKSTLIDQALKALKSEQEYNAANLDQYLLGIKQVNLQKKAVVSPPAVTVKERLRKKDFKNYDPFEDPRQPSQPKKRKESKAKIDPKSYFDQQGISGFEARDSPEKSEFGNKTQQEQERSQHTNDMTHMSSFRQISQAKIQQIREHSQKQEAKKFLSTAVLDPQTSGSNSKVFYNKKSFQRSTFFSKMAKVTAANLSQIRLAEMQEESMEDVDNTYQSEEREAPDQDFFQYVQLSNAGGDEGQSSKQILPPQKKTSGIVTETLHSPMNASSKGPKDTMYRLPSNTDKLLTRKESFQSSMSPTGASGDRTNLNKTQQLIQQLEIIYKKTDKKQTQAQFALNYVPIRQNNDDLKVVPASIAPPKITVDPRPSPEQIEPKIPNKGEGRSEMNFKKVTVNGGLISESLSSLKPLLNTAERVKEQKSLMKGVVLSVNTKNKKAQLPHAIQQIEHAEKYLNESKFKNQQIYGTQIEIDKSTLRPLATIKQKEPSAVSGGNESPKLPLKHHVFMPFSVLHATASPKQPDTQMGLVPPAPDSAMQKKPSPNQTPFAQSTKASGGGHLMQQSFPAPILKQQSPTPQASRNASALKSPQAKVHGIPQLEFRSFHSTNRKKVTMPIRQKVDETDQSKTVTEFNDSNIGLQKKVMNQQQNKVSPWKNIELTHSYDSSIKFDEGSAKRPAGGGYSPIIFWNQSSSIQNSQSRSPETSPNGRIKVVDSTEIGKGLQDFANLI